MKTKATIGALILTAGVVLTGIGIYRQSYLNADTLAEGTAQAVSMTLFIGIALIIVSAILFIMASGSKKS